MDWLETILITSGILTTAGAYLLGGKQSLKIQADKAKSESGDTLTRGADQIVESSNKLVTMLERLLDEEQSNRKTCEDERAQDRKLYDEKHQQLLKRIKELEKQIHPHEK